VGPFLEQAVEPPPAAAVQNALRLLEAIGALEERSERLTVRPAGDVGDEEPGTGLCGR